MVLIVGIGVDNMVIVSRVNRGKALDSNKNTVLLCADIRIVNFIVSPMVD